MASRRLNTRRSAIAHGSGTQSSSHAIPSSNRRLSLDPHILEVPLSSRPPTPRYFDPIQTLAQESEGLHVHPNRIQDHPNSKSNLTMDLSARPSTLSRRSLHSTLFDTNTHNHLDNLPPSRSRTTYQPRPDPRRSSISIHPGNYPRNLNQNSEFPPLPGPGAGRGRRSRSTVPIPDRMITSRIPPSTLDTFIGLLRTYPWGISIPKFLFELREFVGGGRLKRGAPINLTNAANIAASMTSALWDPDGTSYGYESFEDLVADYPDIFLPISSALGEILIFPVAKKQQLAALGITTDAIPIFKYVWNMIKDLLKQHNGLLPLTKIPDLLTQIVGESVDPTNWIFSRELQYYYYYWCYKKLDCMEEIFVEWSLPDPEPGQDAFRASVGRGRGRIQQKLQEEWQQARVAAAEEEVAASASENFPFGGQTREDQVQILVQVIPGNHLTLEYKMIRDARHSGRRARQRQANLRMFPSPGSKNKGAKAKNEGMKVTGFFGESFEGRGRRNAARKEVGGGYKFFVDGVNYAQQ